VYPLFPDGEHSMPQCQHDKALQHSAFTYAQLQQGPQHEEHITQGGPRHHGVLAAMSGRTVMKHACMGPHIELDFEVQRCKVVVRVKPVLRVNRQDADLQQLPGQAPITCSIGELRSG
jgi:hypothetical protein